MPAAFPGRGCEAGLVLFLLAGNLEVLVKRHVVLAVLALDVVGLVAVAFGGDVAFFHCAVEGLDRRLDAFDLLLGQRRFGMDRTGRSERDIDATINSLFMGVPPRRILRP